MLWLKQGDRLAALAMLTVLGLLVYSLIQRQVRQYLQHHHESTPGHKGETREPTAAVVPESFTSVTLIHLDQMAGR